MEAGRKHKVPQPESMQKWGLRPEERVCSGWPPENLNGSVAVRESEMVIKGYPPTPKYSPGKINLTDHFSLIFKKQTNLSKIFKATQLSLGGWINLDSKIE